MGQYRYATLEVVLLEDRCTPNSLWNLASDWLMGLGAVVGGPSSDDVLSVVGLSDPTSADVDAIPGMAAGLLGIRSSRDAVATNPFAPGAAAAPSSQASDGFGVKPVAASLVHQDSPSEVMSAISSYAVTHTGDFLGFHFTGTSGAPASDALPVTPEDLVSNFTNQPQVYGGTQYPENYNSSAQVEANGTTYSTALYNAVPGSLRGLDYGQTQALISAGFGPAQGWTFTQSNSPLANNSLVVECYSAFSGNMSGAFFQVEFVPHDGDPNPADTHWLSIISSNFLVPDGDIVPVYTKVDNLGSQVTPYYDLAGGVATQTRFNDAPDDFTAPRGSDPVFPVFSANTYLVQQLTPTSGIVWGGVNWGWAVFKQ